MNRFPGSARIFFVKCPAAGNKTSLNRVHLLIRWRQKFDFYIGSGLSYLNAWYCCGRIWARREFARGRHSPNAGSIRAGFEFFGAALVGYNRCCGAPCHHHRQNKQGNNRNHFGSHAKIRLCGYLMLIGIERFEPKNGLKNKRW